MKKSEQYTDDMQPDGGRKPTYIKEQHNHNCQQFFGNISNCTFMMPSAPPSEGSANSPTTSSEGSADKSGKRRKKTVTANEKPLTIRYYRHGNKGIMARQRQRVELPVLSLVRQEERVSCNVWWKPLCVWLASMTRCSCRSWWNGKRPSSRRVPTRRSPCVLTCRSGFRPPTSPTLPSYRTPWLASRTTDTPSTTTCLRWRWRTECVADIVR